MNHHPHPLRFVTCLILWIALLGLSACSHSQYVKVTLPAAKIDLQLADQLNDQALLLLKEEQLPEAMTLLKRALVANPQSARTHNNLGKVYYQQNRPSSALRMFRKAVVLDAQAGGENKNPQPHNNLAMIYEQVGKYDLAIEHYSKAHTLAPENIQYTGNLARALHRRGDRDEYLVELLDQIALKDSREDWQHWARTQKSLIHSN